LVSIPIWCDYKQKDLEGKAKKNEFQFQYGAIIRQRQTIKAWNDELFQFQYGAIIRQSYCDSSLSHPMFQFQYGAIIR